MRVLFTFLIILHGLIHLIGFSQAFGLINSKLMTQSVFRTFGILWLFACLLFLLASILFIKKIEFWWVASFISVFVSQILIIIYWQDAKFGTIPNLTILIISIVSYGYFSFNRTVSVETDRLISNQGDVEKMISKKESIKHLPKPVAKWLECSGIIGNEAIRTVYLKQNVQLKMKPNQKRWTKATAVQYFNTKNPSFIWIINMNMMPLIGVVGRDKFEDGKGDMLIKLLSIFPLANSKNNEKVNTGTIQRYLGEIVWFPSAALSPFIEWEQIDDHSSKAIMTYNGTTGEGIFHFDNDGSVKKYCAMRYMGSDDDAEIREWTVAALENKIMNGINVPVKMEAKWKLDDGDWTWLKIEITEISYNNLNK